MNRNYIAVSAGICFLCAIALAFYADRVWGLIAVVAIPALIGIMWIVARMQDR